MKLYTSSLFVYINDVALSAVIYGAIGNPCENKVLEVMKNYKNADYAIISVYVGNILVGLLGFCKTSEVITIRHISVLIDYQRQIIGTSLMEEIKKNYVSL